MNILVRLKAYGLHFDIWALCLFFLIMIPNFIWFAVPAPNDVLRGDSVTGTLDTIASVCQVVMIAALCLLQNKERKKRHKSMWFTPCILLVLFCSLFYMISWILYYVGIVNVGVILGLTVFPCLAFLFFGLDRENWIACVPIIIFTVCHILYGLVNFIM